MMLLSLVMEGLQRSRKRTAEKKKKGRQEAGWRKKRERGETKAQRKENVMENASQPFKSESTTCRETRKNFTRCPTAPMLSQVAHPLLFLSPSPLFPSSSNATSSATPLTMLRLCCTHCDVATSVLSLAISSCMPGTSSLQE